MSAISAMNAPRVHEAWLDVMTAVQSIGKGERNAQQGFNFRGIDATLNEVGPALRDARVFVRPRRILDRSEERYETKGGTQMRNVTLTIEWEVTGPAGDTFTGESVGEAADSGDKAVSKAHSVAYRTFLLQSLTVPTGDREPDADTHERAAAAAPDPRQEWWDRIISLGTSGGHTAASIRKHYAEKQGHEIDGPESNALTLEQYHDKLAAHFEEQAAKRANGGEATPVPADDPWQTPAPVGAS